MKQKSILATVLKSRNFWLALLIMTTANIGNACVKQPVTLLGDNLGLTATILGIIGSGYTIVAMLGRGPFGNAVDHAVHKTWVLAAQYLVRGAVFVGFALCSNIPMYIILKFFQGLTFGMGHIAMMVVLAETMDKKALGSAFGLITLLPKLLSSVTTNITLSITETFGVEYSCYAGAVLSVVPALLCLLLVMPQNDPSAMVMKDKKKFSLKTFVNYRAIPLVLIMTFISVPSLFVDNFMVLFGKTADMADLARGYISSYMWWMGIGAFVAGYLFDRFGFKWIAVVLGVMSLAAQIIIGFSLDSVMWSISAILCGIAGGGIAAITRSYAVKESPITIAALTVATLGVMQDFASLLGSTLGGLLVDGVGFIGTFRVISIFPAVALIMTLFFLPKLVSMLHTDKVSSHEIHA